MIDDTHLNENISSSHLPRLSTDGKRPSYASFGQYYTNPAGNRASAFDFANVPENNLDIRAFIGLPEEEETADMALEIPDEMLFNDINPEDVVMTETGMNFIDTPRLSMSYSASSAVPKRASVPKAHAVELGFDDGVLDEFAQFASPSQAIRAAEMGLPMPGSEFAQFASPAQAIRAAEMGLPMPGNEFAQFASPAQAIRAAEMGVMPSYASGAEGRYSHGGWNEDGLESVWSQH